MSSAAQYRRGQVLRVRLDGHSEPVDMVSIERPGLCAGGGLILAIDRSDGELDRFIKLLNEGTEVEHLRELLRHVADEPNIDRARAMADSALAE